MPFPSSNFLDMFRYKLGQVEVPESFIKWSAISLIAGCLSSRVWVNKLGSRLPPNLYVMMIGPSAIGKGFVINRAVELLEANDYGEKLAFYQGRITSQGIYDYIGSRSRTTSKRKPWKTLLYLVCPELADDIGEGERARNIIKSLTAMYDGSLFMDRTREHGQIYVENQCINCFMGTTRDWLVEVVPGSDFHGGFFGRIITVVESYDFGKRYAHPQRPSDWEAIHEKLIDRVRELLSLEGEIVMSPQASRIDDHWYMSRPAPDNHVDAAGWKRQQELIYKVATVLAVADRTTTITGAHMREAQQLTNRSAANISKLSGYANVDKTNKNGQHVRDIIEGAKTISRSQLIKTLSSNYGMLSRDLDLHLATLLQGNMIDESKSDTGGRVYKWKR